MLRYLQKPAWEHRGALGPCCAGMVEAEAGLVVVTVVVFLGQLVKPLILWTGRPNV